MGITPRDMDTLAGARNSRRREDPLVPCQLTGHAMRFFVGTLVLASELEIEVNPWFFCQITWVSKNGALPGTYFISYKPGSRLIRDETSTRIVRWWTLLYSPNGFDEDVVRLLSRGLQSWKDVRLTRWISSWFVFEVVTVQQTHLTYEYDGEVKKICETHKYEEKLTRDVAMIWKKSNCNVEEAMLSRVSLTCKISKSGDRIQVYESSRDAVLRKVKAERLFSRMLSLQTWSCANGLNW
ncbi:hypothetical protein HID58_070441 [Brassica napus]|uniref:Uncharacterized protein n=2 Tax=Brassica napus TaxID=3708 RepID=A0ABQ7YYR4_BRANA|nr:hypothetical protein HID58_070441 [Brassica napus]